MTPPRWYHLALYRLEAAWFWVTGLRVTTWERRMLEEEELTVCLSRLTVVGRELDQARAQRRQAERLVALLSEPLKDWDLDGFPTWASTTDRGVGFVQNYPLSADAGEHVWELVQTYNLLARDLARVRMAATTNDSARRRGWDDPPLPLARRTALDPRRLP